ncbi:Uncharacterized protein AC507_4466 [Pseudomonas syringae pv. maculicola]|nr:Uncharacterized protein AC507_4466 [Pseudomonas syringae pv. maculicola]
MKRDAKGIVFPLIKVLFPEDAALASDAPSAEAAPKADACKTLRRLTPATAYSALAGSKLFIAEPDWMN